jgi:hypothetical protein
VKLRCYLEFLLRIHRPDCAQCNTPATWGPDIRQRLEELNSRAQQHSLDTGDREGVAQVFDAKPSEGVTSQPVSLTQQKKIV